MKRIQVALEDQVVALNYPARLQSSIEALIGKRETVLSGASRSITVEEESPGQFSLIAEGKAKVGQLNKEDCLLLLIGELVHALITDLDSGVVVHAGALSWKGKGILLPGATGAGKSCLSAWLADKGFDYLTDECVVLRPEVPSFTALSRPLVLKNRTNAVTSKKQDQLIVAGTNAIIWPQSISPGNQLRDCRLVIFPHFEHGTPLRIDSLSAAEAAFRLMACNVNARNLPDHGLGIVTSFALEVPAIVLHYGDFDQLDGGIDALLKLVAGSILDPAAIRHALALLNKSEPSAAKQTPEFPSLPQEAFKVPDATPRGRPRKLTIGMAAYDDYDGVFFTLQALRMYHPEITQAVEFVVIDNNPTGPCAEPMKGLEHFIPNYRYIPCDEVIGTVARERIFEEASGELVLCLDCHVFIVPGALQRLLAYYDVHSGTNDLLQGPLIYDDLKTFSTHFEPRWEEGMFGVWVTDERGREPDAAPFEIPMQGLGLFACRRAAWPRFNSKFRGFGGEEGYIHEKIRRANGRTLCLPFLRWMHRFDRPMGIPYANTWDDRIRNYIIGFTELGWDLQPLKDHFVDFLGRSDANAIFERVEAEFAGHAEPAPSRKVLMRQ